MPKYNRDGTKVLVPVRRYVTNGEGQVKKVLTFNYMPYHGPKLHLPQFRLSTAKRYGYLSVQRFEEETTDIAEEAGYETIWHYLHEHPDGLDLYFS
ncbi:MAG: hypothetical protein ACYCQJ_15905 [Nitrososphaerales archaeon]